MTLNEEREKSEYASVQIEQPQQKEITGKVTDTSGQPFPGATVMVKGTTIGTVTDADGNFSFRIPHDADILQVSFIGMKTKEIPIAGRTSFDIVLKEEAIRLGEVVAIAYGTQRKREITGAISSTNVEDLKEMPVMNIGQRLQGKLPGVQIYHK